MIEREMQELIWKHPERVLNEPLKQVAWELSSEVGRADLVFEDRHGRLLIVEVKLGKLPRGAIDQLHDYFGMMKQKFPDKAVEMMVVAWVIPQERRLACELYHIECLERSERFFREVATEYGYLFASESQTLPPPVSLGAVDVKKPHRSVSSERASNRKGTALHAAKRLTGGETGDLEAFNIRYWTAFRAYLQERRSKLQPPKLPSREHWYQFGIGTTRAHTAAHILTTAKDIAKMAPSAEVNGVRHIGVELFIKGQDVKSLFNELLRRKESIEAIIGASLDWREMSNMKRSRICLWKAADPTEEGDWPQQFAWLQNTLERFDQAFRQLTATRQRSA
jgi:hypothetical protein